MATRSTKVSDGLFLVEAEVPKVNGKQEIKLLPTHNVVILDVSGSMSYDLPRVRSQLKLKVPKILGPNDTLSIIWFSGRGKFGVLLEAEPVATLTDLKAVEDAIDRWLRPVGMTGFKEPLEEASRLIDRLMKKNLQSAVSVFFMSDGCDNQWGRDEIIDAVKAVGAKANSTTFVEYGYYADRPLLTKMAETCGGSLIFAEDFDRYAPSFEAALSKQVTSTPKVKVQVETREEFAFSLKDGEIVAYTVENSAVEVPADTGSIYYLSNCGTGVQPTDVSAKYAAVALYAQRMNSDVVYKLLASLADVRFVNLFASCFGKQKYSEFIELAKKATFDASERGVNGFDPNAVPPDDAFTVLNLLAVLSADPDNRVLVDSKDFQYSRVSRGRLDASEALTADEQAEVEKLTAELVGLKDAKKAKEITEKLAAITNKPKALEFKAEPNKDGYSVTGLVHNSERPNVSFRIQKYGNVDLTERAKAQGKPAFLASVPSVIDTYIYRTYTVVKDGLVNVERLPVRLTAGTIRALKAAGLPEDAIVGFEGEDDAKTRARVVKASDGRPVSVTFDLKKLPIINRKMVKEVSAKTLFEKEYDLLKVAAEQKVYNTYKKELFPRTSKGYAEQYGKEAADWLKEQGITDYSGFHPKTVQAESTDVYMGKEISVSLKGLSNLPSVKDVKSKLEVKAKRTPSVDLMVPAVERCEVMAKAGTLTEEWLDTSQKTAVEQTRRLMGELAQVKFAIVVGQVWPKEFKSLDENSLTIQVDGKDIECKLETREVPIKI